MATMHALFALHEDVARVLAGMLEISDLEALTSVSNAARNSAFQVLRQKLPTSLILPPDLAAARRLINDRGVATFVVVKVATPWHIDLLLEPGVREDVHSVDVDKGESLPMPLGQIFAKLQELENLRELRLIDPEISVAESAAPLIAATSGRQQVINVQTTVQVGPHELQALMMTRTQSDTYNVGNAEDLRLLKVQAALLRRTTVAQLGCLTKLHTLELDSCTITRTAELVAVAATLEVLRLMDVETVEPTDPNAVWEFLTRLTKLTHIHLASPKIVDSSSATLLSTMTRLTTIEHAVSRDMDALARLPAIEHLRIHLHDTRPQDFQALHRLPKLAGVSITCRHLFPSFPTLVEQTNVIALFQELSTLQRLKRVKVRCPYDRPVESLSALGLEHLEFVVRLSSLHSFTSLRSLSLDFMCGIRDFMTLEHLPRLECLRVTTWGPRKRVPPALVSSLPRLRELHINGHFYDWSGLESLIELRSLSIKHEPSRNPNQDTSALRRLVHLREADLRKTDLTSVHDLAGLKELRVVMIPGYVDCTPLMKLPKLVRVLHPYRNCLWSCETRQRHARSEGR